jgi:hypothetical protein
MTETLENETLEIYHPSNANDPRTYLKNLVDAGKVDISKVKRQAQQRAAWHMISTRLLRSLLRDNADIPNNIHEEFNDPEFSNILARGLSGQGFSGRKLDPVTEAKMANRSRPVQFFEPQTSSEKDTLDWLANLSLHGIGSEYGRLRHVDALEQDLVLGNLDERFRGTPIEHLLDPNCTGALLNSVKVTGNHPDGGSIATDCQIWSFESLPESTDIQPDSINFRERIPPKAYMELLYNADPAFRDKCNEIGSIIAECFAAVTISPSGYGSTNNTFRCQIIENGAISGKNNSKTTIFAKKFWNYEENPELDAMLAELPIDFPLTQRSERYDDLFYSVLWTESYTIGNFAQRVDEFRESAENAMGGIMRIGDKEHRVPLLIKDKEGFYEGVLDNHIHRALLTLAGFHAFSYAFRGDEIPLKEYNLKEEVDYRVVSIVGESDSLDRFRQLYDKKISSKLKSFSLLHGDFWHENVLFKTPPHPGHFGVPYRSPMIIDLENICKGDPLLDVSRFAAAAFAELPNEKNAWDYVNGFVEKYKNALNKLVDVADKISLDGNFDLAKMKEFRAECLEDIDSRWTAAVIHNALSRAGTKYKHFGSGKLNSPETGNKYLRLALEGMEKVDPELSSSFIDYIQSVKKPEYGLEHFARGVALFEQDRSDATEC